MLKYKIMIVDDEAGVREGVVNRVDWEALGFEIIAEAGNGNDALEKIDGKEVDVVLTDIKMPFMDGLTMCRRLTHLYPDVKIIILSGFDEFAYAKTAIQLNVVEYILKPINVAELTVILNRVKCLLDDSVARRRDAAALRKRYAEAMPLMREHFLNELLWGSVSGEELDSQMERFELPLGRELYKAVAVFEIGGKKLSSTVISRELVPLSVRQMVEEQLEGHCEHVVFSGSSSIIAISAWDVANPIEPLMSLAGDICLRCKRVLELSVTAGIGRCYKRAEQIHESFAEARAALEYKAVAGSGHPIYIHDMEQVQNKASAVDSHETDRLLLAIKFGSAEQLGELIAELFDRMEPLSGFERRINLLGLFGTICQIVRSHDLLGTAEISEQLGRFMDSPGQWEDGAAMSAWLLNACSCIGEYLSTKRETAARNLTGEAKRFIDEHYHESGLSVERLCEHLHVSQSYFSTIFKRETGKSYVQYLTDIRMMRAAEFLQQSDEKTYEIAGRVGYDEPNYFSYAFKKHFGVSPTKYRN